MAARLAIYITNRITTENGIDEKLYVLLGDQEQYLHIRGKNKTKPVILWLHGGPAGPDGFLYHVFSKYLVEDYTIVSWDQRGCGRTYYHNFKNDPENLTVSFDRAMEDLDQLVDYLCKRFDKEKIILIGHSYGSLPGSKYALEYSNKVAAYIGIGQFVTAEAEFYSYQDALAQARERGCDTKDMEAAYQIYADKKDVLSQVNLRRYVYPHHIPAKQANQILMGLTSPYLGISNLRWFWKSGNDLEGYANLNKALFDYMLETDVREYGLEYQVPVGLISGSEDWSTPVKYVEDYYHAISAPQKNFCKLEGCGHCPQMDEPEEFSHILKEMLQKYLK